MGCNKTVYLLVLFLTIGLSCKRSSPGDDPVEPGKIKSLVLPYDSLLLKGSFISFPDQSFAFWGYWGITNFKNTRFFRFNKDLKLLDSTILEQYIDHCIVRGDKIFALSTDRNLYEINSSLKTLKINNHIGSDLGLTDNSKIVSCIGPDETLILAYIKNGPGFSKLVWGVYGQDISKPLWVMDTISIPYAYDNSIISISYFKNKMYFIGQHTVGSGQLSNIRQFEWTGTQNWAYDYEYHFDGHFTILDSSLYLSPYLKLVLENGNLINKNIYPQDIYTNSMNGFTSFSLSNTDGILSNLSKEFLLQKKIVLNSKSPAGYGYKGFCGPAGPDTWIIVSQFEEYPDKQHYYRICLEKFDKNLE